MRNGTHVGSAAPLLVIALLALESIAIAGQADRARRYDGPQPRTPVMPEYPPVLASACMQGTASVVVEIDKTGAVVATDFVSGPPAFEQVVVETARRWVFESAAEPSRRRQVIRFAFTIVPRRASKQNAVSFFRTPTDAEVRSYFVSQGSACLDCGDKARRRAEREQERKCAG